MSGSLCLFLPVLLVFKTSCMFALQKSPHGQAEHELAVCPCIEEVQPHIHGDGIID